MFSANRMLTRNMSFHFYTENSIALFRRKMMECKLIGMLNILEYIILFVRAVEMFFYDVLH